MRRALLRTAASIKTLMTIKDVTRKDAEDIRNAWFCIVDRKTAREEVNHILRTFGVEYLGQHKRTLQHIFYCNAGDTYAPTVLFSDSRLYVGCWGDLLDPVDRLIRNQNFY